MINPTDGTRQPVRLLLDTGSNSTFIKSSRALKASSKLLGRQHVVVQAFGGAPDCRLRDIVTVRLASSCHSSRSESIYNLQLIMVDKMAGPILGHKLSKYESDFITSNQIVLADHRAGTGADLVIDILVGQDHYHELVRGEKQFISGGMVLIQTVCGFAMGGRVTSASGNTVHNHNSISMNAISYTPSYTIHSGSTCGNDANVKASIFNS